MLNSHNLKILIRIAGTLLLVCTVIFFLLVDQVRRQLLTPELSFVDEPGKAPTHTIDNSTAEKPDHQAFVSNDIKPFREVDLFDEDAKSWSNWTSQYGGTGILVFDANGDGRLDVYIVQDGQNWIRPTDKDGVLLDEPRYQGNILYLNQGNDPNGNPIYRSVGDLSQNKKNSVAELLIEDYLFPRATGSDTKKRAGRQSNVAVAADFNGDGRLDVYIGNEPRGMQYSPENAQLELGQFVDPIGRQAIHSRQSIAPLGKFLIDYEPENSLDKTRKSSRGIEAEGANSLYLNMGDTDNDGVPEWQDVSRDTGVEGFRPSYSIAVADIDLDGDLDIYVGNVMDLDYFPHGAKAWAGGANCLYVNQLAQTGVLRFVERAPEMDVDGVYDEQNPIPSYERLRKIPYQAKEQSLLFMEFEAFQPAYLSVNGEEGEHGQISWTTVFQDINFDGYPDLWVANDLGFLRLYINEKGIGFREGKHARTDLSGSWMATVPLDANGDLKEDLFAGNLGGSTMNHGFISPNPYDLFEPSIMSSLAIGILFTGNSVPTHALIKGTAPETELSNRVVHSRFLPPDTSLPNNIRFNPVDGKKSPVPFDPETLDVYEFSWGATAFDIQNDGLVDIYFHGGMLGRGGGLLPIIGTNPGRLLVNLTQNQDQVLWKDLTAEHHLFNIEELDYKPLKTKGYIYRKAPAQNWHKRDTVYSYDRSSWIAQGPNIQEKVTNQDLIQTAENGRAAVSADLNNDGFIDLVLRNQGGYDSRSSNASNLKVSIDGKPAVLPAHNYHFPSPTNFEPGRTRTFINQYSSNNWIEISLLDDSPQSFNQYAIGAKVVVNQKYMRIQRSGEGSFLGNKFTPLHFGLDKNKVETIEIHWPDQDRTITRIPLQSIANKHLTISKTQGIIQ